MAKGAAMLAPNMATMLAVLTTDAEVEPARAAAMLRAAVSTSFNRLVVDGCKSTNDTVMLLASGKAGPVPAERPASRRSGRCAATSPCRWRATPRAPPRSCGSRSPAPRSDDDADRGARQVADSELCKCSWYGQDPYWGRIASELGSAGIDFDPTSVSVAYGGVSWPAAA